MFDAEGIPYTDGAAERSVQLRGDVCQWVAELDVGGWSEAAAFSGFKGDSWSTLRGRLGAFGGTPLRRMIQIAVRLIEKGSLSSSWRTFLLFSSVVLIGTVRLPAQCPDTGETKVFNSNHGTGYYFYRFLGDRSFRYFLDGKTFSLNDKDDPGRTIIFIDDMAYESIVVEKADFAKYIQGSTPMDILRAQAKSEQDHYKKLVPSVVITDFGPPSNAKSDGSDDRPFYLWKKESPLGQQAATQYLVSTMVKDRVVMLSIMLLKPSVTESDVFLQLQKYTSNIGSITSEQCAKALAKPIAP
jgi:hypothetical protein